MCAGHTAFFKHVDKPMGVRAALIHRGRLAEEVMSTLKEEGNDLGSGFAKVGRNDPCPCESGKKFKKDHGQQCPNVIRVIKVYNPTLLATHPSPNRSSVRRVGVPNLTSHPHWR